VVVVVVLDGAELRVKKTSSNKSSRMENSQRETSNNDSALMEI